MSIKFVVEKHIGGYIAYPLGVQGVVAGQGSTYKEALDDAKSALKFHIETFGDDVLDDEAEIIEAFIEEEAIA